MKVNGEIWILRDAGRRGFEVSVDIGKALGTKPGVVVAFDVLADKYIVENPDFVKALCAELKKQGE